MRIGIVELNIWVLCIISPTTTKKSAATVLKHFEVPEDTEGNFKAKCKHCGNEVSTCSKTCTSTSREITSNSIKKWPNKRHHSHLTSHLLLYSWNLVSKSTTMQTNPHWKDITDKLVVFIAGDLLPLYTVESHEFISFISTLNPSYQLPTRKHLSSVLLKEKCAAIHTDIRRKLQKAKSICLTVDLWSVFFFQSFTQDRRWWRGKWGWRQQYT